MAVISQCAFAPSVPVRWNCSYSQRCSQLRPESNRPGTFHRQSTFPRLSSEIPPPSQEHIPSTPSAVNTNEAELSGYISGTPCFTSNILSSPMPQASRDVYLTALSKAVDAFLSARKRDSNSSSDTPTVAQITLLTPELDPTLDIYDRRFLLQATWTLLSVAVSQHAMRTRVLVQGRGMFGAIPLSVAGLRRTFDADLELSASGWPSDFIRSGDLEDEHGIAEDDDILLALSPTNAVSTPVIDNIISLVERAGSRTVILLNPRLEDVPSHSGVMQVSGRSSRLDFLRSIMDLFYFRLLYEPGMVC